MGTSERREAGEDRRSAPSSAVGECDRSERRADEEPLGVDLGEEEAPREDQEIGDRAQRRRANLVALLGTGSGPAPNEVVERKRTGERAEEGDDHPRQCRAGNGGDVEHVERPGEEVDQRRVAGEERVVPRDLLSGIGIGRGACTWIVVAADRDAEVVLAVPGDLLVHVSVGEVRLVGVVVRVGLPFAPRDGVVGTLESHALDRDGLESDEQHRPECPDCDDGAPMGIGLRTLQEAGEVHEGDSTSRRTRVRAGCAADLDPP